MFVHQKDKTYRTITYISPNKDLWSRADTSRFKAMIVAKLDEKGIGQNRYLLTGPNLLTGDLKTLIVANLKSSLWLAGISIVAVLIIYYRNLKLVFFSMLPLMIGLASLAGIMTLLGLEFNFINLIVIPMIVGIGIDDGVHYTNTYDRAEGSILSAEMIQLQNLI